MKPIGRSASRLAAVQALYQQKQTQSDTEFVITQFIEHQFSNPKEYLKVKVDFFKDLVRGAIAREQDVLTRLEAVLDNDWRIDRLQLVIVCILQVAIGEVLSNPAMPIPVVINEYINITKSFCTPSEVAFVNAALDKAFKGMNGSGIS